MSASPPFALYIRGPKNAVFDLSDDLGFSETMQALALSIFEDGPDNFQLQALYDTQMTAECAMSSLNIPDNCEAFISQLPDEDWVRKSQEGLPPVHAGRFCIFGTHSEADITADIPYPIRIEAGAAFGTGHHGTTQGCLLLFDELLNTDAHPERILDLGCGAGTLAIAAALALERSVLATDIDPEAVQVTRENAQINKVEHRITARCVDGFSDPLFDECRFDLIFANILAKPLMGMAPQISRFLTENGQTILSGILDEQADIVADSFAAQGLRVKKGPSLAGWTSLIAKKLPS